METVWRTKAFKELVGAVGSVGRAITASAAPGHDEMGSHVESLTEAVMGVTAGLVRIADALGDVAEAIRSHGSSQEGG